MFFDVGLPSDSVLSKHGGIADYRTIRRAVCLTKGAMLGGCDEPRQAVQVWRMTEESTTVIAFQAAWWLLQKWLTTWILFGFHILFSFYVNICADQK